MRLKRREWWSLRAIVELIGGTAVAWNFFTNRAPHPLRLGGYGAARFCSLFIEYPRSRIHIHTQRQIWEGCSALDSASRRLIFGLRWLSRWGCHLAHRWHCWSLPTPHSIRCLIPPDLGLWIDFLKMNSYDSPWWPQSGGKADLTRACQPCTSSPSKDSGVCKYSWRIKVLKCDEKRLDGIMDDINNRNGIDIALGFHDKVFWGLENVTVSCVSCYVRLLFQGQNVIIWIRSR